MSTRNTFTPMKEVTLPLPPTLIKLRELLTVWLVSKKFFQNICLDLANVKLVGAS